MLHNLNSGASAMRPPYLGYGMVKEIGGGGAWLLGIALGSSHPGC